LAKLGVSRTTILEQRKYLLKTNTKYFRLLKAAIDKIYINAFFASTNIYKRRLRALVQKTLSDFAEQMRTKGHARIILDGPIYSDADKKCVSRSEYIQEVMLIMKQNRGRELPGTYSPLIVAELFSRQCRPWQALVDNL
jgi:hypothetical protein